MACSSCLLIGACAVCWMRIGCSIHSHLLRCSADLRGTTCSHSTGRSRWVLGRHQGRLGNCKRAGWAWQASSEEGLCLLIMGQWGPGTDGENWKGSCLCTCSGGSNTHGSAVCLSASHLPLLSKPSKDPARSLYLVAQHQTSCKRKIGTHLSGRRDRLLSSTPNTCCQRRDLRWFYLRCRFPASPGGGLRSVLYSVFNSF